MTDSSAALSPLQDASSSSGLGAVAAASSAGSVVTSALSAQVVCLTPDLSRYGCKHGERRVSLRASCCTGFHACMRCHNDHTVHPAGAVSEMVCQLCLDSTGVARVQPINATCIDCKQPVADYVCKLCGVFEKEGGMYHCPQCTSKSPTTIGNCTQNCFHGRPGASVEDKKETAVPAANEAKKHRERGECARPLVCAASLRRAVLSARDRCVDVSVCLRVYACLQPPSIGPCACRCMLTCCVWFARSPTTPSSTKMDHAMHTRSF